MKRKNDENDENAVNGQQNVKVSKKASKKASKSLKTELQTYVFKNITPDDPGAIEVK